MITRRDWLKIAGGAAITAATPSRDSQASREPSSDHAEVRCGLKRLMLHHTWTTTMSSSTYRDTVHVQYVRNGITGYGEGAPIIRYNEYPRQAAQAINADRKESSIHFATRAATVRRPSPGSDLKRAAMDASGCMGSPTRERPSFWLQLSSPRGFSA